MKKVAIIHTSFVSVEDLKGFFTAILPDVELMNIVDDSLLKEVMANGGITPQIKSKMIQYALIAQQQGADLIFNQCSSVGEAIDVAKEVVNIPILKVDEPMASRAVELGSRISVIATVASTMKPSVNLVKNMAIKAGKKVVVNECLVDGALDIQMKEGNREKHNQLLLDKIREVEDQSDVIVLAQGSMLVLNPLLGEFTKPILTSPESGVLADKDYFDGLSS